LIPKYPLLKKPLHKELLPSGQCIDKARWLLDVDSSCQKKIKVAHSSIKLTVSLAILRRNNMKTMSYHFCLGNSTEGPVGFCARVDATSKEEAVELLKAKLPDSVMVQGSGGNEYIEVYLNNEAITTSDIDEVDDDF
jgi:hypothetical protein